MKMIQLYDTLSRTKDVFVPIDASAVRMYVCGPTVYDFAHIGNARPAIVFDVLFRLLRHTYGEAHVTYARNITDVDDKINLRAFETGVTIRELTEGTHRQYLADLDDLGCLRPSVEPRATDTMAEMALIIDRLIARGVAYVAEDHVLFDVAATEGLKSVPRYGSLARRSLDDMIAGARVDVAPYKKGPMDFVLWKPSREVHEPGWPSPGGIAVNGRPGWHIECTAMAWKHLVDAFAERIRADRVEIFDIHGGGIDLVFPHHENENAQTCCAFGLPRMANVWMHNGFLQVEGQKMSKSLGNFTTIREVLNDWPGEVARLAMLRAHYRQPIDWTVRALEDATRTIETWYGRIGDAPAGQPDAGVLEALGDDLNTSGAITALHGLSDPATLKASANLLGLLSRSASERQAERNVGVDVAVIEALIAQRLEARAAKDFARSDQLRDNLTALGVIVMDAKDPATGKPTSTWKLP
jgi:cysteinyl-tRNA synthetase